MSYVLLDTLEGLVDYYEVTTDAGTVKVVTDYAVNGNKAWYNGTVSFFFDT